MQLAYFSPVPWASFRQRPHEFADWFQRAMGGPVLWVDPYPVRLPRASDLRRITVAETGADAQPEWLTVVKPHALPFEPLAWGRALNRAVAWPQVVRAVEAFSNTTDTLLAFGKPSDLALTVLERLPRLRSLYDAMDDFSAFHTGVSRRTAEAIEGAILRRVTWRCTSSAHIAMRMQAQGLTAELIPNGVASDRLPAIGARAADGPLGYVGTVASWFDWDWVHELALAQPQRRIEIHGPVFQAPARVLPDNVSVAPALPHGKALLRMQTFSAGIIPFLDNTLTASVDPVKFYEYRALGLPVLSTRFGEMRTRDEEPGVLLTQHPRSSLTAMLAMLDRCDTAESVTAFRRDNDWRTRFQPLAALLARS